MKKPVVYLFALLSFAAACRKGADAPEPYVQFSKSQLTLNNYYGDFDSITITSNTSWELRVTGDVKEAIVLSQESGSGNATVKITLAEDVPVGATAGLVLSATGAPANEAHCSVDIHTYHFTMKWSTTFGGDQYDEVNSIFRLPTEKYLMSGFSSSQALDPAHHFGNDDGLVLFTGGAGALLSARKAGGTGLDQFLSVVPTPDGGYIAAGYVFSDNGEVVGNFGNGDAWVVKFNSMNDTVWTRTWGGSLYDYATTIAVTPDGHYIVGGMTNSTNGDFTSTNGQVDSWVMKIDGNGQNLWPEFMRMGGNKDEDIRGMVATSDGGCIVAGFSMSTNIAGATHSGERDAYVVRVGANGQIVWEKLIGGNSDDVVTSMAGFPDGSIVFAGSTKSPQGNDTYQGSFDGWLVKMDGNGNVLWNQCFGTPADENLNCVVAAPDGGCIAGGLATIDGRDVSGTKGDNFGDAWLIKVNSAGRKVWHNTVGGTRSDNMKAVSLAENGDLIFAAQTTSSDGEVGIPNKGKTDIWIFRLSVE